MICAMGPSGCSGMLPQLRMRRNSDSQAMAGSSEPAAEGHGRLAVSMAVMGSGLRLPQGRGDCTGRRYGRRGLRLTGAPITCPGGSAAAAI